MSPSSSASHPPTGATGGRPGSDERTIGFLGAAGIGVGAIVGGGIFVLGGVAVAEAGPGAMLAFLLNGGIASSRL
jgi:amino acid transporter